MQTKIYFVFLLLLTLAYSDKNYDGYKVLRFKLEKEYQVNVLNNWADANFEDVNFFKLPTIMSYTEIASSPAAFKELLALLQLFNIKPDVLNENLGQVIKQTNFQNEMAKEIKKLYQSSSTVANDIVGTFARHEEIRDWLKSLATRFPESSQIINIGKSFEGRSMELIRIKTGTQKKPIIFLDSGIHAREWLAPASLIYVINKLLTDSENEKVKKILDKYEVQALPVVNPDGYEYSFYGDRLWRKTRRILKGNCIGVDGNRNFDAFFGTTGVSENCNSSIYPGEKPFSEIETRNLADHLLKIHLNTKLYLGIHTFGLYWLTPYGYSKTALFKRQQDSDRVADEAAKAIEKISNNQFRVAPPWVHLYEASGGAFDWAALKLNIPYSYTPELRPKYEDHNTLENIGFIVAVDQITPSGEELFEAIVAMAESMKV